MSKFAKTLKQGNKAIKSARANIISASAEEAASEIVRVLKKEKRELEFRLLNLTDVHPDSELSLRVVKADFDAAKLFEDIQSVKVDILNKKVELSCAEETYKEWFEEDGKDE